MKQKNDYKDFRFRPIINDFEELLKQSTKLNINPSHLVNFFVKIGLKVLSRSIDEIQNGIESKINQLINESKKSQTSKKNN